MTKDEAKQRALAVLSIVSACIQEEDWETLDNYIERSHAGDGYGDTNDFINFSTDHNPINHNDRVDIGDIVSMIRQGGGSCE